MLIITAALTVVLIALPPEPPLSAQTQSAQASCPFSWSVGGLVPGMHLRDVRKLHPGLKAKRTYKHRRLATIELEHPLPWLDLERATINLMFHRKSLNAIQVCLDPEQIEPIRADLTHRYGLPREGIADGVGESTQLLAWWDPCNNRLSLYLDERPYFWITR
jgi:hypothetical protein